MNKRENSYYSFCKNPNTSLLFPHSCPGTSTSQSYDESCISNGFMTSGICRLPLKAFYTDVYRMKDGSQKTRFVSFAADDSHCEPQWLYLLLFIWSSIDQSARPILLQRLIGSAAERRFAEDQLTDHQKILNLLSNNGIPVHEWRILV